MSREGAAARVDGRGRDDDAPEEEGPRADEDGAAALFAKVSVTRSVKAVTLKGPEAEAEEEEAQGLPSLENHMAEV